MSVNDRVACVDDLIKRSMRQAGNKFYEAFSASIKAMLYQGYKNNILHNPRLVMYKMMGTTIDGITMIKGMEKKISGVINVMKYRGLVQNNWTIDTTRRITTYNSFEDKEDLLNMASHWFYLDRWKNQPHNILLMCEASGYLGVIKHIADQFRVPYVPAKGDMSVQIKMEIADLVDDDTIILYFGDYDTKGLQIPQTIENDIRILSENYSFEFVRMFINAEDIETYNLERDEKGNVQMEQLPERVAIREASSYIEDLINRDLWDEVLVQEETIKAEIRGENNED